MSKGTEAQTISKRSSKASVVGKRTDVVEVKARQTPGRARELQRQYLDFIIYRCSGAREGLGGRLAVVGAYAGGLV